MVWTLVEPGVAIVASSLVTIRPLLRQIRLKGFESSQNSQSRCRSRGLWGLYGRGRGASKLEGNQPSSKRSRAASGMDAFDQDELELKDLEAGHGIASGKAAARRTKDFSSQDTTLTSQSSMREKGLGKSPVRNFSNPLGVIVREEAKEADGDEDAISPVSPWLRMGPQANSSEGASLGQGPGPTLRGHLQNGKTMWRSETPNSLEEAEAIQGLRELASRPGMGRSPFA